MRSDNAALSTVQDALGLGAATVDVAYTGINSAIKVVDQIKSKLVAARQPGVDRAKIQSEITELQSQLRGIADSATFSGQNWLSVDSGDAGYNASKSIVSSFSRAGTAVTIGTISIDTTATELFDADDQSGILDTQNTTTNGGVAYSIAGSTDAFDISALTDTTADLEDLEEIIGVVDTAISSMTDAATVLGAAKARVGIQQDFVKSLMDAVSRGVGQLVDADMNEESTKLQALQVKQQLGVQALSIANQSSQSILSLFR
jgi:flagellin